MRHSIRRKIIVFLCIQWMWVIALGSLSGVSLASSSGSDGPSRMLFATAFDSNIATDRIVYNALKRLHISVSIDTLSMNNALESANSGRYDGLCNQSIDNDAAVRYPNLIKVPIQTATVTFYAYTREYYNKDFRSWSDLSGQRVGSLENKTTIHQLLPKDVDSHTEYSTLAALTQGLLVGECDVIVLTSTSNSPMVMPKTSRQAGVLEERPTYIYLHKRHEAMVPRLVQVIGEMKADGTFDAIWQSKPTVKTDTKSMLYLSSYTSEMAWEQSLSAGISSVINPYPDIIYHNIGMNSLRLINPENRDLNTLSAIRADLMVSPPQAVLVSDSEAAAFFLNYYNVLFNHVPAVLCGTNPQSLSAVLAMSDVIPVTGVINYPSAIEVAEQMLHMFPDTKKIFIINDYTYSGRLWQKEIQKQLAPLSGQVQFLYNENAPIDELLEGVAVLGPDTLILSGRYFLDGNDVYLTQAEFQRRLAQHAHRPIFGLFGDSIGYGQLGGQYADGFIQGKLAAEKVVEILTTGNVPPADVSHDKNTWIFDDTVLKQYGVPDSLLPEGASIIHREPSLRESNPLLYYTMLIVSVMALIIIIGLVVFVYVLFLQKKKLLDAQKRLIVAQRQAELSERDAVNIKNRLQTILETAPVAYSLVVDGVLVEYNEYYAQTIGYEIGENVPELYCSEKVEELGAPLRTGRPVRGVLVNAIKKSGKASRFVCSTAQVDYYGHKALMFWGVEVEELERQKDELAHAHEDLQRIVESNPIPILVLNPARSMILFTNNAFAELFDFDDRRLLNNFQVRGRLSEQPILPVLMDALHTDKMTAFEWEFRTRTGMPFEAMVYTRRLFYGDEECLVMALEDLTQKKARERLLEAAVQQEKDASRLKRHFLMNMSHELRTPLNAIIGLSQLSKQEDSSDVLYENIRQIENASQLLRGIVDNVLDLSLIEEGRLVLKPEQHSLSGAMNALIPVMDVEARKRDIHISLDMALVRHDELIVDAPRMSQVVMVMLSNAIKYSHEHSEVRVSVREVEQDSRVSRYEFSVSDDGIGIPEDKQSRLFKSFEQVDDAITRRYGGAGLGLVVAKNIATIMGGSIDFTSQPDEGSTFRFTMPAEFVSAEPEPTEEPENSGKADGFASLRGLVVDDVEINRMIAAGFLEEMGIACDEAENGQIALDMVSASAPGYYDFVLMDIQMPVMDGYTATKAILSLDREDAKRMPILAISANSMPSDVEQSLNVGMRCHIGKPFYMGQLVEAIKKYVVK